MSNYSFKVEVMSLFVVAGAFGGWIGLIWPENEEFSSLEFFVYYTEHMFTSLLGTMVLHLGGRV